MPSIARHKGSGNSRAKAILHSLGANTPAGTDRCNLMVASSAGPYRMVARSPSKCLDSGPMITPNILTDAKSMLSLKKYAGSSA